MDVKAFYEQIGGSYEDVIGRMQLEKLVVKYLLKFADDPSFHQLDLAMQHQDMDGAFRASHTLKGICGNLGLKRLYEASHVLTESLRNHEDGEKVSELFLIVQKEYKQVVRALETFKDN